ESVRKAIGLAAVRGAVQLREKPPNGAESRKPNSEPAGERRTGKFTEEQVAAARIGMATGPGGALGGRLLLPGTILPQADRIARVSVQLSGTVAQLRKNLGDHVTKDEVLAILESREVADAKSEYLARKTTHDLQQTLFARAKMLWEGKAT